jgi:hypothetical protein
MASNTLRRICGPVALSSTYTTNILNVGTYTGGTGVVAGAVSPYLVVRHIHVTNKATTATFRLYLGLTAANTAGTELIYDQSIPTGTSWDWYGAFVMVNADFLVGGASAATTLTLTAFGEVGS